MYTALTSAELERSLSIRDLSDPSEGPHAIQCVVERVREALVNAWAVPVEVASSPRIVSVADNYDHLRYSAQDVTRASRYTRYVGEGQMLRSHTSAGVPGWLRALPPEYEDQVVLLPGICYRRDVVDRTHVGEPHQMDIWRVSPGVLGEDELFELATLAVQAVWPDAQIRLTATSHPYTREGRQIDVLVEGEWLEVGECGLAHPKVLEAAGVQGAGLAMGVGLDRLVMLAKRIPDIRLLRSQRPEVAAQMGDLAPYRAVPSVPSIRRDISIVLSELDEELLGDAAGEALGAARHLLREVRICAVTPYEELPPAAHQRMGMAEGQLNVLLRLTLQAETHTLTDGEANELRTKVYHALHEGACSEL